MSRACALVIGMGPGLGRALVHKFAQEGHRVAFIGRRAQEVARHEHELKAAGLEVMGIAGDAGKPDVMSEVHERIRKRWADPEVLIYNAALIEPSRFVTQSGMAEVQYGKAEGWASLGEPASVDYLMAAFRTNVAGALHAAQVIAPSMLERGSGTILLSGGVLAFGPWIEWGVTSLCKAALRSLGQSLAIELNDHGIHVCTVAVHGTMAAGTPYDHGLVADAYWGLYRQPREEWEPEFHFRAGDRETGDPDAIKR